MTQKLEANLLFREFGKVETTIAEWQAADGPVRYIQGNQVKAISAKLDNFIRLFLNYAADSGREVDPRCKRPSFWNSFPIKNPFKSSVWGGRHSKNRAS